MMKQGTRQGAAAPALRQPIPLDITGVATLYELGTPQQLYRPVRERFTGRIVGFFCLFIGALIIGSFLLTYTTLLTQWPLWETILVPVIGVGWLALGSCILFVAFTSHSLRVYVCPEGLVYAQRSIEALRWNQMERIWKNTTGEGSGSEIPVYVIRRSDDTLFFFDNELERVEELGRLLEDEVTSRLLPRAIKAFNAGSPVLFEEIVVSKRGIGVRKDRRWLSWQEFATISTSYNSIIIQRHDSERPGKATLWATVRLSAVPNVEVLRRLVAYHRHEQVRMQLPQIMDYNAGNIVHFGALQASKQGLIIDNGRIILPWSEIASMNMGKQEVIIRRKGSQNEWYTLPGWMVHEKQALKELLAYVTYSQYSST